MESPSIEAFLSAIREKLASIAGISVDTITDDITLANVKGNLELLDLVDLVQWIEGKFNIKIADDTLYDNQGKLAVMTIKELAATIHSLIKQ